MCIDSRGFILSGKESEFIERYRRQSDEKKEEIYDAVSRAFRESLRESEDEESTEILFID